MNKFNYNNQRRYKSILKILLIQVNFTGDELGYNNYTDTAQDGIW